MDSSSSFEHKQIVLSNSRKFFQFLHKKMVKMKLLKILSCMNCSGLGYCISGVAGRLLED